MVTAMIEPIRVEVAVDVDEAAPEAGGVVRGSLGVVRGSLGVVGKVPVNMHMSG